MGISFVFRGSDQPTKKGKYHLSWKLYSLRMLQNKLTASVTFRDVLGTYYNRVSSSFVNQSSFYDKDINLRSVVFAVSYVFDKGRKKDIKTGVDIKEEKERLKQ